MKTISFITHGTLQSLLLLFIIYYYYYLKLFKHGSLSVLYWFTKGLVFPLHNLINLDNYKLFTTLSNFQELHLYYSRLSVCIFFLKDAIE